MSLNLHTVFRAALPLLLLSSAPAAALVANGPQTATVHYTTGNVSQDGYEHMGIDIEYQLHICSGRVYITAAALPETRRSVGPRGMVYWYQGVAYPVPSDIHLPQFTVATQSAALFEGGTVIGRFSADIGRRRQAPGCATGWQVGDVPSTIRDSKSEDELQDFIDRLQVVFDTLSYPMKNPLLESRIRADAKKAKAEEERKELEAKAEEARKKKEEETRQARAEAERNADEEGGSTDANPQGASDASTRHVEKSPQQLNEEYEAALERKGEENRRKFNEEKEREYEEGQRRARENSEAAGKMVEGVVTAAAPAIGAALDTADTINRAAPMYIDLELVGRTVTNYRTSALGFGFTLRAPGIFNVVMGFSSWTSPQFSKQVRTPGLASPTSGELQFRIFDNTRVSVNTLEIGLGFSMPGIPGDPTSPLSFRFLEGGVQIGFYSVPKAHEYLPETKGAAVGFFVGTGVTYRVPKTGLAFGVMYRLHSGVWPDYPNYSRGGRAGYYVVLPEGDEVLSSLLLSALWRFDI